MLVAFFLAVRDQDLWIQYGFNPNYPTLLDAFASLFIHTNLLHLLGNMLFLAAVGAAVELAAGSVRFTIVYFAGGLAGVLVHLLVLRKVPEAPILIGASAAVASCVAYYAVRYSRFRVPLMPGKGVSVAAVTAVWVLLQVAGAMFRVGDNDAAVAYWAHLGGFSAGLLLSVLFQAPRMADLELGHEVLRQMNERSAGAALTAADVHLGSYPKDVSGLRQKAEAQARLGDREQEAGTLLILLDKLPESQQGEVLSRLGELGFLTRMPALRRTLLAERFKASDPAVAEQLLKSVLEDQKGEAQRPDALLAMASLQIESGSGSAKGYLDELVREHPLHPATELARARGWVA